MNLLDFFNISRLPEVVDIGANPIDGDPPYKPLLAAGLCRVTGFEPQEEALASLNARKGPNETYLPNAVYDGSEATLRICEGSGMTSLLEPDPVTLGLFTVLAPYGRVKRRVAIPTTRLDDIEAIERLDFLKMDIQGGEHTVLVNGRAKLAAAVVVQLEVSFITLYKDQAGFGEIDQVMRSMGFIPHTFAAIKKWPLAPHVQDGNPRKALNQLLEADLVYTRDFTRPELMSDEQLKHLALIAHVCYGSFDLASLCIEQLIRRGTLPQDSLAQYAASH